MKIGIFGGSFNPIHIGHLIVAEEVFQERALAKVVFIPTGISPHKEVANLIDASHRYQMVKEAIQGNTHFEVSDLEIKRSGKSYTIDTIRLFREIHGEKNKLYLIVGTDMMQEIRTWKNIEELSGICHFVVVNRFQNYPEGKFLPDTILSDEKNTPIEKLMVRIPPIGISSSEIRDRLREGRSIRYLVPENVERYIRINHLYR
ncbi:MAG: nicotinate-nucleotide adenylyltransferase [Candidatus Brocadiaceae bacterium]|nr:nicotinate-nucleotide adenylyltransferase [Candidatus Brocadiaceae bacterium]